MRRPVLSITEKVPQTATLPDGLYYGTWNDFIIDVTHNGKIYQLETTLGETRNDVKVAVEIKNGVATFEEFSS